MLDNSVALAWCFEDEQTPDIMALLDRVAEQGAVAPQLWPVEALNGLLTAERRQRITRATRHKLAGFIRALPIRIDDETAPRVWIEITHLAETYRLTAYDSCYLELAQRLTLPLATTDAALREAAAAAGVPLLPAAP